jgi:hypothetical protein
MHKHLDVSQFQPIEEYCRDLVERNKNSPDPLVRMFFGPQSLSAFSDDDKRLALVDIPSPLETMAEVEIMVEYLGMEKEEAEEVLKFRDMQSKLRRYEDLKRELLQ